MGTTKFLLYLHRLLHHEVLRTFRSRCCGSSFRSSMGGLQVGVRQTLHSWGRANEIRQLEERFWGSPPSQCHVRTRIHPSCQLPLRLDWRRIQTTIFVFFDRPNIIQRYHARPRQRARPQRCWLEIPRIGYPNQEPRTMWILLFIQCHWSSWGCMEEGQRKSPQLVRTTIRRLLWTLR